MANKISRDDESNQKKGSQGFFKGVAMALFAPIIATIAVATAACSYAVGACCQITGKKNLAANAYDFSFSCIGGFFSYLGNMADRFGWKESNKAGITPLLEKDHGVGSDLVSSSSPPHGPDKVNPGICPVGASAELLGGDDKNKQSGKCKL